jgi:hypothetical protein
MLRLAKWVTASPPFALRGCRQDNCRLRVLCASVSSVFKETPRVRPHGMDRRFWEAAFDTERTEAQRNAEDSSGGLALGR